MSSISESDIRAGYQRHRDASRQHLEAAIKASEGYLLHRAGSLIHHYFSLLEDPEYPTAEFSELFAINFYLDFTMTQISTFAGFTDWLRTTRESVDALTISVSDLDVIDDAGGTFTASMDIELDAIGHDGERKAMSTHHVWTIDDHGEDRFAKIVTMIVKMRT
ncbi:MAG: hypothetical protein ACI81L_002064 [Verrucomicrobiales bacterium]|jgi:hypothetical protein